MKISRVADGNKVDFYDPRLHAWIRVGEVDESSEVVKVTIDGSIFVFSKDKFYGRGKKLLDIESNIFMSRRYPDWSESEFRGGENDFVNS